MWPSLGLKLAALVGMVKSKWWWCKGEGCCWKKPKDVYKGCVRENFIMQNIYNFKGKITTIWEPL